MHTPTLLNPPSLKSVTWQTRPLVIILNLKVGIRLRSGLSSSGIIILFITAPVFTTFIFPPLTDFRLTRHSTPQAEHFMYHYLHHYLHHSLPHYDAHPHHSTTNLYSRLLHAPRETMGTILDMHAIQ